MIQRRKDFSRIDQNMLVKKKNNKTYFDVNNQIKCSFDEYDRIFSFALSYHHHRSLAIIQLFKILIKIMPSGSIEYVFS